MADHLIAAIDIGSSKIATIVGVESKEDDELRIIGFNSTPSSGVKKGLVVDIDKVTKSVEESIEKVERMAGQKVHAALVSVGGPHISSLNSRGVVAVADSQGEISETDINRVIEAARAISLSTTRQIIEISPRDFVVDGQEGIKNPIGMSGVRLEVETHIITASHTNLKNIDRCMESIGVGNRGFIFAGLASSEAVLTETEKELGVVCVDVGGGKTDIALYVDGSLSYSSSIPIGARHITNDIAVGLRVSLDSAEKIKLYLSNKLEHGGSKIRKKIEELNFNELQLPEMIDNLDMKTLIDGIIGPRLEEIYKMVSDEIIKSNFIDLIPSGLVITGGGALTVGILEMGRKTIGLPVRIGVPGKISGLIDEIIDPQFSTTVGLILYGRKNIMNKEEGFKNFNKILKDFSLGSSVGKMKDFFKQFIP